MAIATVQGTVTAVHRNSDKSRTVTITLDKAENEYTTYSFSLKDDNLGLDQRVAVMVQPVDTPVAERL